MENEIIKIGLTGKMRSGKDTVAKHLFYDHGFSWPIAFGDALKHYAHEIFPDVPKDPKPRELYQFMNVMRDFDPDVWVKHLARTVEFLENDRQTTGIVVTDARQPNEIKWLQDNGFVIVKVVAPDEVRKRRMETAGEAVNDSAFNHRTEKYVDDIEPDYMIHNDGTIGELESKVDELMDELVAEIKGEGTIN